MKLRKIKLSKRAPVYFLRNEIRREVNRLTIPYGVDPISGSSYIPRFLEDLEAEYECYFRTKEFVTKTRAKSWRQYVYAGLQWSN
ncbi:hypothetical protein J4479_00820 [Candidatus Woesearchaeota archaeon]|nr:hypothetical protein [Candidatus Woesearchaeota archaeon]